MSPKDVEVHMATFGLNLDPDAKIDIQKLHFANILKKLAYEVFVRSIDPPSPAKEGT